MRKIITASVAGAALTAALVSGTAAASAASSGGAQTAAPACTGSQLHVGHGYAQGAMGHGSVVFRFENTSQQTCSLTGYPGVDADGKGGKLIKSAKRTLNGYTGGAKKVQTIDVRPGHFASADLEWLNFNPHTMKGCATSHALRVTPANTGDTQRFGLHVSTCVLRIHPTVAGKSGNS